MLSRCRFLPLLFAAACSDYALDASDGENIVAPAMVLDPQHLALPPTELDASTTGVVSVRNDGDAALTVHALDVRGSAGFTIVEPLPPFVIDPGAATPITLAYSPRATTDEAHLDVSGDDPDRPTLSALLTGEGLLPQLTISPSPLDLGGAPVECPLSDTVALMSTGGAPVTVTSALLVGEGFTLDSSPVLPQTLAPGEQIDLDLSFTALALGVHDAALWAESDSPAGTHQAQLTAEGVEPATVEELFRQPDGPYDLIDMVFYVDQSTSMNDNKWKLRREADGFIDHLTALELDWQLAVITANDGCRNVQLTAESPNASASFQAAITGAHGNMTEHGLALLASAADQSGWTQCNEDMLRDDARAIFVAISDEPDQSEESWNDLALRMISRAGQGGIIAAIVGPVPDGCEDADPGTGYVDAAAASHGMTMNICEDAWTGFLEDLSDLVTEAPRGSFLLTGSPIAETIGVQINGVSASAWQYDDTYNAIVFDDDAWPPGLAEILVTYQEPTECGE